MKNNDATEEAYRHGVEDGRKLITVADIEAAMKHLCTDIRNNTCPLLTKNNTAISEQYIKLPCKVGDKIYTVENGSDIGCFTVNSFLYNGITTKVIADCIDRGRLCTEQCNKSCYLCIDIEEFGRTLFGTKEEALASKNNHR